MHLFLDEELTLDTSRDVSLLELQKLWAVSCELQNPPLSLIAQYEKENSPSMKLCNASVYCWFWEINSCNHISAGFQSSFEQQLLSAIKFHHTQANRGMSVLLNTWHQHPAHPQASLLSDITLDRRSGTDPVRLANMQHNCASESEKSMLPCSIWDSDNSEHVANMH